MAAKDENILDEGEEKESVSQRRLTSCRHKSLHGQFLRGIKHSRDSQSRDCYENLRKVPETSSSDNN